MKPLCNVPSLRSTLKCSRWHCHHKCTFGLDHPSGIIPHGKFKPFLVQHGTAGIARGRLSSTNGHVCRHPRSATVVRQSKETLYARGVQLEFVALSAANQCNCNHGRCLCRQQGVEVSPPFVNKPEPVRSPQSLTQRVNDPRYQLVCIQ